MDVDFQQAFVAIGLGLILSPFYGLGLWLRWQSLKVGTIIPVGKWTASYGEGASRILRLTCIIVLLITGLDLG